MARKRNRITEEHAWLALAWLCKDLDTVMLNCPAHIAERHESTWRIHGFKLGLHGTQAGLSIHGMSVVYYEASREGYRSGGGFWTDGLSSLAGDTWRELVGRINAAREGIELARCALPAGRGLPWEQHKHAHERG